MLRLLSLRGSLALLVLGTALGITTHVQAQLVPGTGNLLNTDEMEDTNWGYTHNFPKSSKEEDETIRYPLGGSHNRMWSESPKRGSPDVVKRVETPAGGLAGSTGALYLRTRDTGIPGRPGFKQAQDDFILAARPVGVGYSPNFVVRVFLPEFKDWEQRQGVSFGIRAGLQGMMTKQKPASIGRRLLRGSRMETVTEVEPYYPGFFIAFNPLKANAAYKEDHAQILIRSDQNGHEVAGPKITQTGWWTFGMSVTPDSRCHYYAHPGVADLTAADHIYSSLPYGIRGDFFNTIFFNVCSADDGNSWSTPWIIDDPKVYYSGPPTAKPAPAQQAQQQQPVKTAQAPAATPNAQNASLSKESPAAVAPAAVPSVIPAAPAATASPLAPPAVATPDVAPTVIPPVAPATVPAPTAPDPLLAIPPVASPTTSIPVTPPAVGPVTSTPAASATLTPGLQSTGTAVTLTPLAVPSTPATPADNSGPPKDNPFEVTRQLNVTKTPSEATTGNAISGTEKVPSAPKEPVATPVTPPDQEPPLEVPILDDETVEVDPTPVPQPPSD